jgi:hypothetical protein
MSVKVVIDCASAGVRSGDKARIRESTRMLFVGYGLAKLGYDVHLTGVPGGLPTWKVRWNILTSCCRVADKCNSTDILITVGETESRIKRKLGVGFKTSVSCKNDHVMVGRYDIAMMHEYNMAFDKHQALFPIPFMVHEDVIRVLEEHDLLEAFLNDDLEPIRKHYAAEKREPLLSYCGANWHSRQAFFEGHPEWAEVIFYETTRHRLTQEEHLHWLPSCLSQAVLCGDSPKCNLYNLCAMLGVPIVYEKIQQRIVPNVSDDNAIVVDGKPDWDDLKVKLSDDVLLAKIAANATRDYKAGWSPLGMAKQLDKKFRDMGVVK